MPPPPPPPAPAQSAPMPAAVPAPGCPATTSSGFGDAPVCCALDAASLSPVVFDAVFDVNAFALGTTVLMLACMGVLLCCLGRLYGRSLGSSVDLESVRRRAVRAAAAAGKAKAKAAAGGNKAGSGSKGGLSEQDPLLAATTTGESAVLVRGQFVLPAYFLYAGVAALWFVVEGVIHLLPHRSEQLVLAVRYGVTVSCDMLDAFVVIFLLLPRPGAQHATRYAMAGMAGYGLIVLSVLLLLPQSAAEECAWCSVHTPTPYAAYLDGVQALTCAVLATTAFARTCVVRRLGRAGGLDVGGSSSPSAAVATPSFVESALLRWAPRRPAIVLWCTYLFFLYTTTAVSAGLHTAGLHVAALCLSEVQVLLISIFYSAMVWITATRDSAFVLTQGYLDRSLTRGGGGSSSLNSTGDTLTGSQLSLASAAFDSSVRLVDPTVQGGARAAGGGGAGGGGGSSAAAATRALLPLELFRDGTLRLVDESEIDLEARIGLGGYGEVWRGVWRESDTTVAVKKLLAVEGSEAEQAALRSLILEMRLQARLNHPNVLPLLAVCVGGAGSVAAVTPFIGGGTLFDAIRKHRLWADDPAKRRSTAPLLHVAPTLHMARTAVRGLAYLHGFEPPVLHRDLKSPNLLFRPEDWSLVVADFGLSRAASYATAAPMTAVGSVQWSAPEVLVRDTYSESADVYSFGVVLWEMVTGRAPWQDWNMLRIAQAVAGGQRPPLPPAETLAEGSADNDEDDDGGGDAAGGGGAERHHQREHRPHAAVRALARMATECWDDAADARPSFASLLPRFKQLASIHGKPPLTAGPVWQFLELPQEEQGPQADGKAEESSSGKSTTTSG